ncbi:Clr5 domain-containing protein [Nemania sp. NC0429]|nr:Clr5 domain-containing protein [Nemania sp. NC0429]
MGVVIMHESCTLVLAGTNQIIPAFTKAIGRGAATFCTFDSLNRCHDPTPEFISLVITQTLSFIPAVSTMASNDWERHKATILNLYLLENAPVHRVVSYMRDNYNFVKTKAQYEYQFKKWGAKKNATKETWQGVAHQINKRRGKHSETTLVGMPVSAEKTRRMMQRYASIPTANEFGRRLASPEMPMGMVIRVKTPPSLELEVSWPSTLPWFTFKNRVLPTLHDPLGVLRAFFNSTIQHDGHSVTAGAGGRLASVCNNPAELLQAVRHLRNAIPNDLIDRQQEVSALARSDFSPYLVTEMLKIIFFRLSNNMDDDLDWKKQSNMTDFCSVSSEQSRKAIQKCYQPCFPAPAQLPKRSRTRCTRLRFERGIMSL